MAKKKPKSKFEKAVDYVNAVYGCIEEFSRDDGIEEASWEWDSYKMSARYDGAGVVQVDSLYSGDHAMQVDDKTSIGEIARIIVLRLEEVRQGIPPPETPLGGNGKDFEELLLVEARRLERDGTLTMGRYGVQVSLISRGGGKGKGEWTPVESLPDFEGAFASGRQFIAEAKVCSGSSFEVRQTKIKTRQVKHMLRRSRFAVPCGVIIHFNPRLGKTFYEPALTVLVPVNHAWGTPLWKKFAALKDKEAKTAQVGSMDRREALHWGIHIPWHIPKQCKKSRPDLEGALNKLRSWTDGYRG